MAPLEIKLLVNTTRVLSCSHYLVGYDLPGLFVNGKETAKINAKEWRPLKQLAVGDRLGLLYEKDKMKISVFINGDKETGPLPIWPTHVASSRLIQKGGCTNCFLLISQARVLSQNM